MLTHACCWHCMALWFLNRVPGNWNHCGWISMIPFLLIKSDQSEFNCPFLKFRITKKNQGPTVDDKGVWFIGEVLMHLAQFAGILDLAWGQVYCQYYRFDWWIWAKTAKTQQSNMKPTKEYKRYILSYHLHNLTMHVLVLRVGTQPTLPALAWWARLLMSSQVLSARISVCVESLFCWRHPMLLESALTIDCEITIH